MTNSNSHCILLGDFNINLLNIKEISHYHDHLLNTLSYGFHPKITQPTRFTDSSASLIDNICSNIFTEKSVTGLLISNISDHLPYFYCFNQDIQLSPKIKYVYNRKINHQTIMSLKNYLSSLNITYQLCYETRYNPNDLYNKLEHMITTAMDACRLRRRLKFNKYKHKKSSWISFGIINSIQFRDKLYKDLKKLTQAILFISPKNKV